MKPINQLIRKNILALKPYSCARDEFKGEASVYLDANENPMNAPYNRYPDPLQWELKKKISEEKDIAPERIMLGNGSDEPIDLIYRIFCEPKTDNAVAIAPTYGMYGVCADINDVEYRSVALGENFALDAEKLLAQTDAHTKIVWLCSPNNPSGNLLTKDEIRKILTRFDGIVVIDEAYIDFADTQSWLRELDRFPNLIVLQTFSKAWGMAAARCGMAFASEEIIAFFNKVKYPYNVNLLTQNAIGKQLENKAEKQRWVDEILAERSRLAERLKTFPFVEKIFPTDANFLLVRTNDADGIYRRLVAKGIIVRNRNTVMLCGNCLRITVGTAAENRTLTDALAEIGR